MCRVPQFALKHLFAVALVIQLSATVAWAASYKILHNFSGQPAGNPSSGLVADKAGNGYGTTAVGGTNHAGTVYQLSPKTGFSVIYTFSGPDGRLPQGSLVVDAAGNLYGTTVYGGANMTGCNNQGCGTVFRLSPPSNSGTWIQTVLYSFTGGNDGANPQAGVILDAAGNLYGTTEKGSAGGGGLVFALSKDQNDHWTENVLYAFDGSQGAFPLGGVVFDGAGNLYGTSSAFGPRSGGSVFELSPIMDGTWTFKLVYAFDGTKGSKDAYGPGAGVIFDAGGSLYGTTVGGGDLGLGTVFELAFNSGNWTEIILHSFAGGTDGATPVASVALDNDGNLYGTTFAGGSPGFSCSGNGCGTVFELIPGQNGQWTERRFVFPKNGTLGIQPTAPVLLDQKGNVYGTTTLDGRLGAGVVFRITQ